MTEEEMLVHLAGLGVVAVALAVPALVHALRVMRYDRAERLREQQQEACDRLLSQPRYYADTPMAARLEDRSTHPGEPRAASPACA